MNFRNETQNGPQPAFSGLSPLGPLFSALWLLACSPSDPEVEALQPPLMSWATYTIAPGFHGATVSGASAGNPLAWFTTVEGRDYLFRFNASAQYEITHPTEPADQMDWNKLPGLSDCDTVDLAQNGAMFGWRFRLDTTPRRLEVTAYGNNSGKHLWTATPLLVLDEADLVADTALRYRLALSGGVYDFSVSGVIRGRTISAQAKLPRACPATSAARLKWASGLYFGGTSTAPSKITGAISETRFVR